MALLRSNITKSNFFAIENIFTYFRYPFFVPSRTKRCKDKVIKVNSDVQNLLTYLFSKTIFSRITISLAIGNNKCNLIAQKK